MKHSQNISRRAAIASASAAFLAAHSTAFADEITSEESQLDNQTEMATLTSSDVTKFLYIDNKTLGVGSEQHIVLSLSGYSDFSSASIVLKNNQTNEDVSWGLTSSEGSSMLFSFAPSEGSYRISKVTFSTSDSLDYEIDFSDCEDSYCSFVVGDDASTLSLEDEENESVTATAVAVDGTTVEAESVEEAASAVSINSSANARSAVGNDNIDGVIVVALDPGHGGYDSGASGVNGSHEATMTWKIAQACKTELERYAGVMVFLTRTQNECPSIENRAITAIGNGADVLVSLHLNAAGGGAHGAEVWAPSDSSYNPQSHAVGEKLGKEILDELEKLGLYNRGVKFKVINNDDSYDYSNGSSGDYYGITRYARKGGIPGIIVEHAFIDNSSDYNGFLASDSKLESLGKADATGIAQAYGLTVANESDFAAVYNRSYYLAHNADVQQAFGGDAGKTFNHFLTAGMKEGRQAIDSFDPKYYRNANADLRELFGSNLACYYYHYIRNGKAEKRAGTGTAAEVNTMWRMYNSNTGEHFYTASDYERNVMVYRGWKYEGVGWTAPASSSTPVYRLYNSYVKGGDHHYTVGKEERASLIKAGWTDEGIGWYSDDKKTVPVYRQYNPHAVTGTHNYTTSKTEHDHLGNVGWNKEGIAWYGL